VYRTIEQEATSPLNVR